MTQQQFKDQQAQWKNMGTHKCAIKLIEYDLIKKERTSYVQFQSLMPALKKLREVSDYQPINVSQSDGHLAMSNSDSIKNILTKNYR